MNAHLEYFTLTLLEAAFSVHHINYGYRFWLPFHVSQMMFLQR